MKKDHKLLFLQLSDVLLDDRAEGLALGLSPKKAELRRQEARKALSLAADLALDRGVDAVLIPGNLWVDEDVLPDTVQFVQETFRRLAPTPVFIVPGQRDPFHPHSPYHPNYHRWHNLPPWPDNVKIFTSPLVLFHVPGPGLAVGGRATRPAAVQEDRPLAKKLAPPLKPFRVLLYHGELRSPGQTGGFQPFDEVELLRQNLSYVALGGCGRRHEIRDQSGKIRAAYSGSLLCRAPEDRGPKGALLFTLEPTGVAPTGMEIIPLDARRVATLQLELTETVSEAALKERLLRAAREAAHPCDMVIATLTGLRPAARPPVEPEWLASEFFHVRVLDLTEPDYDLKAVLSRPPTSVEVLFVQKLLKAAPPGKERPRAVVREALQLGLDALTQGAVHPPAFTAPPLPLKATSEGTRGAQAAGLLGIVQRRAERP